MAEIAVLGVGNPFRGDDGAGWKVIDILESRPLGDVKLCKVRGELSELLELFTCYPTVFCVDACMQKNKPGSWTRIEVGKGTILQELPQTSTHSLSVSQAIGMAESLNLLPKKLIIYAITGSHFAMSDVLADAVLLGASQVALQIEEEVQACMKKA